MVELPEPGARMVVGLKLTVVPIGTPEAERLMGLLNPPLMAVVIINTPRPFSGMLSEDGVAEIVKLA